MVALPDGGPVFDMASAAPTPRGAAKLALANFVSDIYDTAMRDNSTQGKMLRLLGLGLQPKLICNYYNLSVC
jgi:hypothetical protein